jgi:hypothetical protein
MKTICTSTSIGGLVSPTSTTGSNTSISDKMADEARARGWNRIIDYKLLEWGNNPSVFDPDEIVPPTPEAIKAAYNMAQTIRDAGIDLPDWVEPSGNGGIAFRWGSPGQELRSLEISDAGRAELIITEHCLVRERISF